MSNSSGKYSLTNFLNQFMASCLMIAATLAILLCVDEVQCSVLILCSISCHSSNSCFFFGCSCSVIEIGTFLFVKNVKYCQVKYKLNLFTGFSFLLYSSLKSFILLLLEVWMCISVLLVISGQIFFIILYSNEINITFRAKEIFSTIIIVSALSLFLFFMNFIYPV